MQNKELKECSRCHSEIETKYFGTNRKGIPFKTCDNCRKPKRYVKCILCNKQITYSNMWNHKTTPKHIENLEGKHFRKKDWSKTEWENFVSPWIQNIII